MPVQVLDVESPEWSALMSRKNNLGSNHTLITLGDNNYICLNHQGGAAKPCRMEITLAKEQALQTEKKETIRLRLQHKLENRVPKIENK